MSRLVFALCCAFLFSCAGKVTHETTPVEFAKDAYKPEYAEEIRKRIERFYENLSRRERELLIAEDPLTNAILHIRYAKDAIGRIQDERVDLASIMEDLGKIQSDLEALRLYLEVQDRKEEVKYCIVTANRVNVRMAPSLKARVVKQVSRATRLRILEVGEKWVKVKLGKRKFGYVWADLCEIYYP